MLTSVALILTAVLMGCKPSPPHTDPATVTKPDVMLAMDRKAYNLGDPAQVTIVNDTGRAVLVSLVCDGLVEGYERDKWQTVYAPDCSSAPITPSRIDGGESLTAEYTIRCSDEATLARFYTFRLRVRFQFVGEAAYGTAYSSWFVIDER